jgi:hypothetical protein
MFFCCAGSLSRVIESKTYPTGWLLKPELVFTVE